MQENKRFCGVCCTAKLRHYGLSSRKFEHIHTRFFPIQRGMNISVKRDLNAAVTEYLRKRLYIKAECYAICGECVTKAVEMN